MFFFKFLVSVLAVFLVKNVCFFLITYCLTICVRVPVSFMTFDFSLMNSLVNASTILLFTKIHLVFLR